MGNSGKNTARIVKFEANITPFSSFTVRMRHIFTIEQDRGGSLGISFCLGQCLGPWLEGSEDWRVTVLFHETLTSGRKEVLSDMGEGHLPPSGKEEPWRQSHCDQNVQWALSEASRHPEEIAAALDTASTQEASGWEDLSYQNLEACFPRGRTKGEWGSHRLGVTWERVQHVSPLCTSCGTPLSCREAETIQNPATRGRCEGCGRKCKGTVQHGAWKMFVEFKIMGSLHYMPRLTPLSYM